MLWIEFLAAAAVLLSIAFACVTPFAPLAALAALVMPRRGGLITTVRIAVQRVVSARLPRSKSCSVHLTWKEVSEARTTLVTCTDTLRGADLFERIVAHTQPVVQLGWLAAAGMIGFLGNEAVAVFRINIGRQINSTALIADRYHTRTHGLTILAVILGAFGVWMGYPRADPAIGLA